MAKLNALYETPRDPRPRLFLLGYADWIDLDEEVEVRLGEPEAAVLGQRQAVAGRVQSLFERRQGTVRLVQQAPDLARVRELQAYWAAHASKGEAFTLISDRGFCYLLAGDKDEDERQRQLPLSGSQYTIELLSDPTLTFVPHPARRAVFLSPADPGGFTRTNLFDNGDILDGIGAWTNNTPATLHMEASSYLRPDGTIGQIVKFVALGTGTKSAQFTFDTAGVAPASFPTGGGWLSFLFRSDRSEIVVSPLGVMGSVMTIAGTGGGTVSTNWAPTPYWRRQSAFQDFAGNSITSTQTTGHTFELTFPDDMRAGAFYVTELQFEGRKYRTAFIPYSTVRTSLTGSRTVDKFKATNLVQSQFQFPLWVNNETAGTLVPFGLTAAAWVMPSWDKTTGNQPGFQIRSGVNDKIDFHRGSTDYHATLTPGQYAGAEMAYEVKRALVAADSGNSYTASWNATTLKFTIAGSATFTLKWNTGSNVATSAAATLGYLTDDDDTGTSIAADTADPGAVSLLRTADYASINARAGLIIATSHGTITVAALTQANTVLQLTHSYSWTTGPAHVAVSWQDSSNPGTAADGSFDLYVNGSKVASNDTHDDALGSLGEKLWLGTLQDEVGAAAADFWDVHVDPVFIDGASVTIGEYHFSGFLPERRRSAFRCKVTGQALAAFNSAQNQYDISPALVEEVFTPGSI